MFYFDDFFGKKVLKSTVLEDLEHFFTTRDFVLSFGERKDLEEETGKNRDFLCEKFGILKEKLITCKQVHSDNIQIYEGRAGHFDNCDALITTTPNTALILNFADCVPVIIFDSAKNIASIVHAGWRGTVGRIVYKTAHKFVNEFSSNPKDIKAAIGPCISKCCFSVNQDVYDKLSNSANGSFYEYNKKEDKYYIDLKKLNKQQLLDNGIEDIDICTYCTSCMSDLFFSYRCENGITGRHSAVVKL